MQHSTIVITHLLPAALSRVKVPDLTSPNVAADHGANEWLTLHSPCSHASVARGLSIFSSSCRTHGPRLFSHLDQSNASDTQPSRQRLETDACIQGCQQCERDTHGALSRGSQTPEMGSNALARTLRGTACCVWVLNTAWTCSDFPRAVGLNVTLLVEC